MTRDDDELLSEVIARGRRAWPGVVLERADLAAHLAAAGLAPSPDLHADVYLACACLRAIAGAREAFESAVMVDVPKAVRKVHAEDDFVAEVTADLRLALLETETAGPSLLARYRGAGPLRSFVMVLAMRRAVDRRRRQKVVLAEPSTLAELSAPDTGIGRVEGSELREAFLDALKDRLATLGPRERNVLRLHVVDGVSAEAIARMYNVHRATATRWIVDAKRIVFEDTKGALRARFSMSPETFESFARDEALRMDVTLSTFLRPPPGERPR